MSTLVSDSFLDLTMATAGDDDDRILFSFSSDLLRKGFGD